MSYTVGLKRRVLPGYRKIQVKSHRWENFRFILDMEDGSQLLIPGFRIEALKVYADFHAHYAVTVETTRRAQAEAELKELRELQALEEKRRQVQAAPVPVEPRMRPWEPEQQTQEEYAKMRTPEVIQPAPVSEQDRRAQDNARQHVERILSGNGQTAGLASRPPLS